MYVVVSVWCVSLTLNCRLIMGNKQEENVGYDKFKESSDELLCPYYVHVFPLAFPPFLADIILLVVPTDFALRA